MQHVANRRAFLIGSGGQARVIASFLPHSDITLLVESNPRPGEILQSEYFSGAPDRDADHFVAIGDDRIRRGYFDRLQRMGVTPASCIAPTAWIAESARLGDGVFIGAGAVIGAGATIGDNAMVNNLSLVDHDSILGRDSQVTVGCMLGAELVVGERCFFGMKCCVISRLTVGNDVFVMAGAVVVRDVAAGSRVGGVPAAVR